jgi:serpin B
MGERVTRLGAGTLALAAAVAACAIWGPLGVATAGPGGDPAPRAEGLPPAAASAELGLDLLETQPPGNAVVAPDSVLTALAMTGTGARGRTAADIVHTLHLRNRSALIDVGRLQRAIASKQAAAGACDPSPPVFSVANRIFLQQDYPLLPSFVAGQQRHFGAEPQLVDFVRDEAGALRAVNGWVSEQTEGLIPDLFPSFSPDARLVLVNAVYLKAAWLRPFTSVSPAVFHAAGGRRQVDFMHETRSLRYASGEGFRAVELPYRASTLSMLVVMPTKGSLGSFQNRLSAGSLAEIAGDLSIQPLKLSMPRFHLDARISLTQALKELGMGLAFSEQADFSGMTGNLALKIGEVRHAVDIAVDEEGTVAAGATGVEMVKKSKRPTPIRLDIDRPFLFFLRDTTTGAVLFAGRMADPAAAG